MDLDMIFVAAFDGVDMKGYCVCVWGWMLGCGFGIDWLFFSDVLNWIFYFLIEGRKDSMKDSFIYTSLGENLPASRSYE